MRLDQSLLGRDDLVALGERLGVTHREVAVVERNHANRTGIAARVLVNEDVDARPLADQQLAPDAEDHRRQVAARTLREVRRHLLGDDNRVAVEVVDIGAEDKVAFHARGLLAGRGQLRLDLAVRQERSGTVERVVDIDFTHKARHHRPRGRTAVRAERHRANARGVQHAGRLVAARASHSGTVHRHRNRGGQVISDEVLDVERRLEHQATADVHVCTEGLRGG